MNLQAGQDPFRCTVEASGEPVALGFGTPVASEDRPCLENMGAKPDLPETASKRTNGDSSPRWQSGVERVLELNGQFWVALSQERGATCPPCMSLFGFGS